MKDQDLQNISLDSPIGPVPTTDKAKTVDIKKPTKPAKAAPAAKTPARKKSKTPEKPTGGKKQNSKVATQQKRRRRKLITTWRVIKYGMNSFARNAWLSVASTAIMTITLLIIFGTLVARVVLTDTVQSIRDKVDISIYVERDISEGDAEKIKGSLANLESVKDVTYTSPEEARANFASRNSSDEDIRAALIEAENEFFGIFNVNLVDLGDTTELEELVSNDKTIIDNLSPDHQPTYDSPRKDAITTIASSISFAEKVGIVAGAIFTVIASLIIFNTIRMAIFNRREEIYMMELIGANKGFIRGPFIIESIMCGILAAFLASGLGYAAILFARPRLEIYGVIIGPLAEFLVKYAFFVVIAIMLTGSMIGAFSSLTATKKYLKN